MRYPLAPKRGKGIVHLQSPCTYTCVYGYRKARAVSEEILQFGLAWRGEARKRSGARSAGSPLRQREGRGQRGGEEKRATRRIII